MEHMLYSCGGGPGGTLNHMAFLEKPNAGNFTEIIFEVPRHIRPGPKGYFSGNISLNLFLLFDQCGRKLEVLLDMLLITTNICENSYKDLML